MKLLGRLVIATTIISALLIPGCYTVVKHPTTNGKFLADQTSNCISCHAGYTEFPYGHYYSPTPDYWWDNPRYGEYYTFPWWWSYYEYSYLDGEYRYDSYSAPGQTKFEVHEVTIYAPPPPYSFPYTNGGGYFIPGPVIIPNIGGPSGGTGTGANSRPSGSTDGSRSRDGSTGSSDSKETRQSTGQTARPTPKSDNSSSDQNSQPAPKKDDTSGKKKSRRGGGGGGGSL